MEMNSLRHIEREGGADEASDDSADGQDAGLQEDEDKFAQHVEEAKEELRKQVQGMFLFSMVFTLALCGLFYYLIENQEKHRAATVKAN